MCWTMKIKLECAQLCVLASCFEACVCSCAEWMYTSTAMGLYTVYKYKIFYVSNVCPVSTHRHIYSIAPTFVVYDVTWTILYSFSMANDIYIRIEAIGMENVNGKLPDWTILLAVAIDVAITRLYLPTNITFHGSQSNENEFGWKWRWRWTVYYGILMTLILSLDSNQSEQIKTGQINYVFLRSHW